MMDCLDMPAGVDMMRGCLHREGVSSFGYAPAPRAPKGEAQGRMAYLPFSKSNRPVLDRLNAGVRHGSEYG